MAGVGVLALRVPGNAPLTRLWCDGSYGFYLHRTLHQIAQELVD